MEGPRRFFFVIPRPVLVFQAVRNELHAQIGVHDIEQTRHLAHVRRARGDHRAVGLEITEPPLQRRSRVIFARERTERHVIVGKAVAHDDVGRGGAVGPEPPFQTVFGKLLVGLD